MKKKNPFDLSKAFRINKPVFRAGLGLILLLFVACLLVDGVEIIRGVGYIECPEDSPTNCGNPFYDETALFCDIDGFREEVCISELFPGQVIGHKPSWLSRHLYGIVLLIVLGCVLLNWYINHKKGLVNYDRLKKLRGDDDE